MNETGSANHAVLVILEVSAIHDQDQFKAYQLHAREQIGKRGGAVVARGGSPVEGSPPFQSLLVQKWPSERAFLDWQESEEYQPLRSIRLKSASTRIAIVPLVGQQP
jgi:uncharacterized protein (DUF1330 family)